MPYRGFSNNPAGINSFSGPLGQKEPAYGAVERLKQLTAAAPPGSPQAVNAPRRAKRRAVRRGRVAPGNQAAAVVSGPPPQPNPMLAFWQQLSAEPGLSDLVYQYAAEAMNG